MGRHSRLVDARGAFREAGMDGVGPTAIAAAGSSKHTKRVRWSAAERRRTVEETLVPGASVALVARSQGINANQVFT
jgi:Transposase